MANCAICGDDSGLNATHPECDRMQARGLSIEDIIKTRAIMAPQTLPDGELLLVESKRLIEFAGYLRVMLVLLGVVPGFGVIAEHVNDSDGFYLFIGGVEIVLGGFVSYVFATALRSFLIVVAVRARQSR